MFFYFENIVKRFNTTEKLQHLSKVVVISTCVIPSEPVLQAGLVYFPRTPDGILIYRKETDPQEFW